MTNSELIKAMYVTDLKCYALLKITEGIFLELSRQDMNKHRATVSMCTVQCTSSPIVWATA